jgi:Gpi18-like mannosyltransferase
MGLEAMDAELKKLITITIFVKLTIFILIISSYFILASNMYYNNAHYGIFPHQYPDFFSLLRSWDAGHYLSLAENGYPNGVTESTAFYPLYPFLIKSVGFLFFGNTLAAGLLVSNVCSLLAIVYFYLLVKKLYNDTVAFTASLFMLSFVTFFYTALVYSEGLFLLLVIAFFYYVYEKKFYPGLFLSILIPLTRPTGILVAVPLFGYLVLDIWNSKKVTDLKNCILILGFITGFLLYLGIMNYFTGSFFSGFDAEKIYFPHNSLYNLLQPVAWFQNNFLNIQYSFNGYTTSILNRIFFGFFLILLYFIYKYLDTTLFLYSLALGLIPALSDSFMSYIRFILVIFPIFIVLALRFQKNPYLIIIPSAMFQVLLLIAHTLNYWVA